MTALLEEVAKVRHAGGKCLVFSQNWQLLEMAELLILQEHGDEACINLKEDVRGEFDLESDFRLHEHRFVMLLTAGAFAMGLTLTMADTCIIVEPQLDVATEIQIEHRTWRPGQMADRVRIVKLYMAGTIEEQLVEEHKEHKSHAEA